MQVTITINCDNAAFGDTDESRGYELRDILESLAERLSRYGFDESYNNLKIRDSNGNTVGQLTITE